MSRTGESRRFLNRWRVGGILLALLMLAFLMYNVQTFFIPRDSTADISSR
jgi:hypothetical protein